MKKMNEVYKDDSWGWSDYQPMIDSFGYVQVQVDDNDYQGDTRVLLEKEGKYGHLLFGWGSCSGCDSLQACGNIDDVQQLADELYDSIKWFEGKSDCLDYFKNHDWEGDYCWHQKETKEYIDGVIEFLSN